MRYLNLLYTQMVVAGGSASLGYLSFSYNEEEPCPLNKFLLYYYIIYILNCSRICDDQRWVLSSQNSFINKKNCCRQSSAAEKLIERMATIHLVVKRVLGIPGVWVIAINSNDQSIMHGTENVNTLGKSPGRTVIWI